MLVAAIWMLVLSVATLAEVQRFSIVNAIISVLIPYVPLVPFFFLRGLQQSFVIGRAATRESGDAVSPCDLAT